MKPWSLAIRPNKFMQLELKNIDRLLDMAGIAISDQAIQKLIKFYKLLITWNEKHNLTGPLTDQVLMQRHCLECLLMRPYLSGNTIADLGSGAGLPGLPLAIAFPELNITLIESRQKRVQFMSYVKDHLGLLNVNVIHSRIELIEREKRSFDCLTARAVAPIDQLIPLLEDWLNQSVRLVVPCQQNVNLEELLGKFSCYKIEKIDFPRETQTKSGLLIIEKVRPL
jgi:16S rRNA (guanine527-N7)-methyltransferase